LHRGASDLATILRMVTFASLQIEPAKPAILIRAGEGEFETFSFWSDVDDSITVSSLSKHELIGFYIQEQPEIASADQSIQQHLVSLLTTES